MKQPAKKILGKLGYEIHKVDTHAEFPIDFNKTDIEIIKSVKPFTLTSIERCFALIQAVNYKVLSCSIGIPFFGFFPSKEKK